MGCVTWDRLTVNGDTFFLAAPCWMDYYSTTGIYKIYYSICICICIYKYIHRYISSEAFLQMWNTNKYDETMIFQCLMWCCIPQMTLWGNGHDTQKETRPLQPGCVKMIYIDLLWLGASLRALNIESPLKFPERGWLDWSKRELGTLKGDLTVCYRHL